MDDETVEMEMNADANDRNIRHYFEYSNHGIEVLEDGLKEMAFGEYLVENHAIDRFQLFRALQMQDRNPGVRLGECLAALGYLTYHDVERHLEAWNRMGVIEA
jgi:hypothetical protein